MRSTAIQIVREKGPSRPRNNTLDSDPCRNHRYDHLPDNRMLRSIRRHIFLMTDTVALTNTHKVVHESLFLLFEGHEITKGAQMYMD